MTALVATAMLPTYNETRKDSLNFARCLLAPLKQGKPVVLIVHDARAPKKKRAMEPLLFLTPLTIYGQLSTKLNVAYQAHGCEVVDTAERITPMVFIRVGMSPKLAAILAKELTTLFHGD